MTPKRREVRAELQYFTKSGKFFTRAVYDYEATIDNPLVSICAHLKGLADQDSQDDGLPGIGGYWAGPILVTIPKNVPRLIFPCDRTGFREQPLPVSLT